mgnify:CR=1 FL=1
MTVTVQLSESEDSLAPKIRLMSSPARLLYVDSLFFLNFIMNLYLLILVNRSTFRTATPGRIAAGAALGAAGFLLSEYWGQGWDPAEAAHWAWTAVYSVPLRFCPFIIIMKRMMPMHYELYVDSLFFLNFIMNLYLLILVNRSTFRWPLGDSSPERAAFPQVRRSRGAASPGGGLGKQSGGTHQRETCLRGGEKGI